MYPADKGSNGSGPTSETSIDDFPIFTGTIINTADSHYVPEFENECGVLRIFGAVFASLKPRSQLMHHTASSALKLVCCMTVVHNFLLSVKLMFYLRWSVGLYEHKHFLDKLDSPFPRRLVITPPRHDGSPGELPRGTHLSN